MRTIVINYDDQAGEYHLGFMEGLKLVRKEIVTHHDEISVMVYDWMVHGTVKMRF
jgi:hypothetical protein